MRWGIIIIAALLAAGVFYVLPPTHAPTLASWAHVSSQFKDCAEPAASLDGWPIATTCDGLTIIASSASHSRDDLCRIEIMGDKLAPRALMALVDDPKRVGDLQFAVSELRRPYDFDRVIDGIQVHLGEHSFSLDAC